MHLLLTTLFMSFITLMSKKKRQKQNLSVFYMLPVLTGSVWCPALPLTLMCACYNRKLTRFQFWTCCHFCSFFMSRSDGPRQPAVCRTASRTPVCSMRRCTLQKSRGLKEVATTARLRTALDPPPSSPLEWMSTVSASCVALNLKNFFSFVIQQTRLR